MPKKSSSPKQLYCIKCKKAQRCHDVTVQHTKNNRYRLKGVCSVCGTNTGKFISASEGSGLLSMLGLKIPVLSDLPVLGDLIF